MQIVDQEQAAEWDRVTAAFYSTNMRVYIL
jgi:hypothetical protein